MELDYASPGMDKNILLSIIHAYLSIIHQLPSIDINPSLSIILVLLSIF